MVTISRLGIIIFVLNMKRILILFLLLGTGSFAQTDGPVKFYYPNGKVSSEGNFKGGQPDGYWRAYYDTGILKSEGNRVNGQLDSLWRFYDEMGNKTSDILYREGQKNGWQRDYYQPVRSTSNGGW